MSLRTKLSLWLVVLHLVLAAAAWFLLRDRPPFLIAAEVLFAVSVAVSVRLVRSLFVPLDLVRTGADLIAERDFTTRFVPVGQPEIDGLIDVYNRMIDRLREERLAAEERQQLLQKIVEASPSGIVICDFDGRVEQMNPAAKRLASPQVLERLMAMAPGESRLLADRGSRRLKVWRAEFRDRGFAKAFFLLDEVTEDIRSSEKAAYEKLIRMMSHEVNNSVAAVGSLLESIRRYEEQIGAADRDDFRNAVDIASNRMDALNRFMGSFADLVRIPPPHRTDARIGEVVQRSVALLRPELEKRGIRATVDLDGDIRRSVDVVQMEQVIINVLRNAIDAIGTDGTIDVRLRDGVLTIADSGPGLPGVAVGELFTPFFTTKREGRGLGLTIVQEILANHGLTYSLQNRPEGGAEFRVAF